MNQFFVLSLCTVVLISCKTPDQPAATSLSEISSADDAGQPKFVTIRKGQFLMGADPTKDRIGVRQSDETQHVVTISYDFEIQTTEVTQRQWFEVMGSNPSKFAEEVRCRKEFWLMPGGVKLCPNHPVEQVSWNDIVIFLGKLNAKRDGYLYRLPTEAEWEYAARGGRDDAWSVPGDFKDFAWVDLGPGLFTQTQAVAKLRPNAYGLYDVHGNVWEWVSSWYGPYPASSATDPVGPSTGKKRIVRGCGYQSNIGFDCRVSKRYSYEEYTRLPIVGFRLVRVPAR